jgi:hypothetical protein
MFFIILINSNKNIRQAHLRIVVPFGVPSMKRNGHKYACRSYSAMEEQNSND